MENYSLSDIRAATGDGMDGFGGGGAWFLIILFLFMFGMGGNGFGGRREDAVSYEILSNQHFNALDNRITNITNGICDSTYAITNAITAEGRATQTAISALAAKIDANEIQNLRDKVADLQLQTSQCRQNEYLVGKLTPPCPVPAYVVQSPYCCNPCGYNGF